MNKIPLKISSKKATLIKRYGSPPIKKRFRAKSGVNRIKENLQLYNAGGDIMYIDNGNDSVSVYRKVQNYMPT